MEVYVLFFESSTDGCKCIGVFLTKKLAQNKVADIIINEWSGMVASRYDNLAGLAKALDHGEPLFVHTDDYYELYQGTDYFWIEKHLVNGSK